MHNLFLCPRTTILIKLRIETVCFFYPMSKQKQLRIVHYALCIDTASCTTSVYVNLSKNSLFLRLGPTFWAKAGAKVLLFSEPAKLFGENFRFLCVFLTSLDIGQAKRHATPYYI